MSHCFISANKELLPNQIAKSRNDFLAEKEDQQDVWNCHEVKNPQIDIGTKTCVVHSTVTRTLLSQHFTLRTPLSEGLINDQKNNEYQCYFQPRFHSTKIRILRHTYELWIQALF